MFINSFSIKCVKITSKIQHKRWGDCVMCEIRLESMTSQSLYTWWEPLVNVVRKESTIQTRKFRCTIVRDWAKAEASERLRCYRNRLSRDVLTDSDRRGVMPRLWPLQVLKRNSEPKFSDGIELHLQQSLVIGNVLCKIMYLNNQEG